MQKICFPKASKQAEELLPEYRFDYSKAKPNRFTTGPRLILLDEDVAQVFKTPDAVNRALRELMELYFPLKFWDRGGLKASPTPKLAAFPRVRGPNEAPGTLRKGVPGATFRARRAWRRRFGASILAETKVEGNPSMANVEPNS